MASFPARLKPCPFKTRLSPRAVRPGHEPPLVRPTLADDRARRRDKTTWKEKNRLPTLIPVLLLKRYRHGRGRRFVPYQQVNRAGEGDEDQGEESIFEIGDHGCHKEGRRGHKHSYFQPGIASHLKGTRQIRSPHPKNKQGGEAGKINR